MGIERRSAAPLPHIPSGQLHSCAASGGRAVPPHRRAAQRHRASGRPWTLPRRTSALGAALPGHARLPGNLFDC